MLALAGLASPLLERGSSSQRATVLVAARPLPAGKPIPPDALQTVEIDADAVSPGMLRAREQAVYARPLAGVAAGEYVTRALLATVGTAAPLRSGERAVSLRLDPAAVPPPSLLGAGSLVDVAVASDATLEHGPRTEVVASALELLAPARSLDGVVVVTLRAPLRAAVRLTSAQTYARDLRLLLRARGDVAPAAGLAVEAGSGG